MDQSGSIESAKRSDTAELRRRFDAITKFLAEGYNHKQICEHLNKEGLAIPYRNYRAIMTRLRRERSASGVSSNAVVALGAPTVFPVVEASPSIAVPALAETDEKDVSERKFAWNPGSKVKW